MDIVSFALFCGGKKYFQLFLSLWLEYFHECYCCFASVYKAVCVAYMVVKFLHNNNTVHPDCPLPTLHYWLDYLPKLWWCASFIYSLRESESHLAIFFCPMMLSQIHRFGKLFEALNFLMLKGIVILYFDRHATEVRLAQNLVETLSLIPMFDLLRSQRHLPITWKLFIGQRGWLGYYA